MKKHSKKPLFRLNEKRDIPLLRFLWFWKLATTKSLHVHVYPELRLQSTYCRLQKIMKGGFITKYVDNSSHKTYWILTAKGFSVVKEDLPELKEDGYKSEFMRHDHIVMAAQLGDFISDKPEDVIHFTEQVLRRFHFEFLPKWLPNPALHRPDGYTYFAESKKLVAVEVEISQKIDCKLRKTIDFYRSHQEIDAVMWIIKSKFLTDKIRRLIKLSEYKSPQRHNFVLLDEFLIKGYQSVITDGQFAEKTMWDMICKIRGKTAEKSKTNYVSDIILETHLSY